MNQFSIEGQIFDVTSQTKYGGKIIVRGERIHSIIKDDNAPKDVFITPGFIDAHVHIESSMLVPSEFAKLAVIHGTIATVSDPHEIGNVLGAEGVRYMINNGNLVNFKFHFGAPSCVPATPFETAGASITADDIEELFKEGKVKYLAEMMNWPGVLERSEEVMTKIKMAQNFGYPVDGHAPGLKGELARKYIDAGISTDHECFTYEEALDKLNHGMKVIIREGSAAKNFDALIDLLPQHYEQMMFCSDDKHPDSLLAGHINELVKRSLRKGIDLFKILTAACLNPVKHYGLPVGLLNEGDYADFLVLDNLEDFNVNQTFINGICVVENGKSNITPVEIPGVNKFNINPISSEDIRVGNESKSIRVIEAMDGQLITNELIETGSEKDGWVVSDPSKDVLKIVVQNRYSQTPPAIGFIRNFGFQRGAIASSVAHDSHNVIAVGVADEDIVKAINLIIRAKGGISLVEREHEYILPLPIAGLMSDQPAENVASEYTKIDKMAKDLGSNLQAPYMTLSFMALLVIPSLKMSDKGLFNGDLFEFVNLFEEKSN